MKVRVGLFFGGASVEHEVSVISALQALQNIDRGRYEVTPVYITKDGEFYTGEDIGKIESYRDISALLSRSVRCVMSREHGRVHLVRQPAKKFGSNILAELDVALPIVHGTNCEDGSLQGLFTVLGLPYAGSDVLASAVGMDKYVQKLILKDVGVPVLDAKFYTQSDVVEVSEYPVVVKPINLGSSVGISIVRNAENLKRALDLAFGFSEKVLIERAVTNLKEINCAVLGDAETAEPSVCEEPLGSGEILSYTDKYLSGDKAKQEGMASLGRKIPADISSELEAEIQALAVRAFKALGLSGVCRIDFLVDLDTNAVYLNEVNTIPGSLAFYLWKAAGVSYTEELTRLIDLALARDRRRRSLAFTFDTNLLKDAKIGGSKGKV